MTAAFAFRVLMEPPTALYIPAFAIGIEVDRAEVELAVLSGPEALKRKVSGNTGRALLSGRYGEHQMVNVRSRVGQRTAVYSSWIAFDQPHQAEAFVRENPRLGLVTFRDGTTAAITERQALVKNGMASGRYDLGRIDSNARLSRAKEFVRLFDELDKLGWTEFAFSQLDDILGANPEWQSVG